jgi:hypothetical protein
MVVAAGKGDSNCDGIGQKNNLLGSIMNIIFTKVNLK